MLFRSIMICKRRERMGARKDRAEKKAIGKAKRQKPPPRGYRVHIGLRKKQASPHGERVSGNFPQRKAGLAKTSIFRCNHIGEAYAKRFTHDDDFTAGYGNAIDQNPQMFPGDRIKLDDRADIQFQKIADRDEGRTHFNREFGFDIFDLFELAA